MPAQMRKSAITDQEVQAQAEQDREGLREAQRKLQADAAHAASKISSLEEQLRNGGASSQRLQADLDNLRSQKQAADAALSRAQQDHQKQVCELMAFLYSRCK